MNKWKINEPDRQITDKLAKDTGLQPFICRLLVSRGITSREEADIFFNSSEFADPFDIKDMDKAVKTINEAVANGDRITIYGDYDCDGVTSTYMLFSYLEALGAEVSWYIPTRDEGYGLNIPATDLMHKQGTKLIITVDNGISAVKEAEHIRELGMKLVVTDHHQVPEKLPYAEAIVNPHRPDDMSLYKHLAGCCVVQQNDRPRRSSAHGKYRKYGAQPSALDERHRTRHRDNFHESCVLDSSEDQRRGALRIAEYRNGDVFERLYEYCRGKGA